MWTSNRVGVLAILLFSLGCSKANPRLLPHEVSGMWVTDAPGYKDRFLELGSVFIFVGAGERGKASTQAIDSVETSPAGHETIYTIYSTTSAGTHDRITIRYTSANGGELRIKDRDNVVWRREQP